MLYFVIISSTTYLSKNDFSKNERFLKNNENKYVQCKHIIAIYGDITKNIFRILSCLDVEPMDISIERQIKKKYTPIKHIHCIQYLIYKVTGSNHYHPGNTLTSR